jgi:hypothetical protein
MSAHSRKKSLTEIIMDGDEHSPLEKDVNRERTLSNTDSRSASSTNKAFARKGTPFSFSFRSVITAFSHLLL